MHHQGFTACQPHQYHSTNKHINKPCSHSVHYYITLPSCCCNISCCPFKNKNNHSNQNSRPSSPSSSISSASTSTETATTATNQSIKSSIILSKNQNKAEKTELIIDENKPYKVLSHAIDELFQTEENYIYDLTIMVEICIIVLHQQKWIIKEHIDILSRNIKDILDFHKKFYESFMISKEKNQDPNLLDEQCKSIATNFLHCENDFMSLYIDYCHGHDDAWKLCTEYRNKPEWNEFIDQCQLMLLILQSSSKIPFPDYNHNKNIIRFEDLLIKPVQRICRYQLLIKEIIRHANQCFSSTPSQSLLQYSFKNMYDIATEIDKQNEIRDSHEKTNRFIQRLESDWRVPKQLVAELGYIVISGAIEMKYQNQLVSVTPSALSLFEEDISVSVKSKYYGCFIFNTYVMFVRPKKQASYELKHWFPLHLAELLDNGNETEFTLKCDQHKFYCKAACLQEKQTWLEKIQLAKDHQKQHSLLPPKGIVSSLNSDFLTSFASTSRHPSDIHSIYQHQQIDRQRRIHRSNSVANYHQHYQSQYMSSSSKKGIDHPSIMNENDQQKKQKRKSSLLKNQKRKSILFPLSTSTSSPSILLTNDANGLHQYIKDDNIKNGTITLLFNHPTSMNISDENCENHTRLSKIKHRHSSLDLLSMTKNRVSVHLKSQRKNSVRETIDHRLKDVSTKDYLSSHACQFSGRRKSSIYSSSTVSTPTSSPINTLSHKKTTISSPLPSSSSQLNPINQNNDKSSTPQTKELLSDSNRFNLPLLPISSPTTTFMDDPSLTFTSSPMELNDTHRLISPTPESTPSYDLPSHRLPISYSLPINVHQNTQNPTIITTPSFNQLDNERNNYTQKKRNSIFFTSFQLSATKKSFNVFSKGFKWTRFFKNTN